MAMTNSIRTVNGYLTTRWHLVCHGPAETYAMNTPAGCVILHHFSERLFVGESPASAASSSQVLLPGVRLDQRWEAEWVEPDDDEDGEPRIVLSKVYKLRASGDHLAERPWQWYDADDDMPRPTDADIRAAADLSREEK